MVLHGFHRGVSLILKMNGVRVAHSGAPDMGTYKVC